MSFILKMAWRDSRSSRGRLLFFSLSIVFGIGALVALGSFSAGLGKTIRAETKSLLGADLAVSSRTPLTVDVSRYLESLGGERADDETFSSMMVFPTAGGATRLVQVRAMSGGFPFYGDFITEPREAALRLRPAPAKAAGRAETDGNIVILEDTLLSQFHVKVGDRVKLGRSMFTVVGGLKKIAGESLVLSLLAPRALVPLASLGPAGLGGPSPLARYRAELKLPPSADPEAIVGAMRERFGADRLSYDTVESRKRDLGRSVTNIDAFLSLVGFVALLLGAIGIASAVHVHVREKLATAALLRCLGAAGRQSFAVYLVQGCALGAFGALAGGALGVAVQAAFPSLFADLLPVPVKFGVSWPAVARGMGAGWTICGLFTLLPLLALRRVSPLGALRSAAADPAESRGGSPDPWVIATCGLIALAVAAFAIWQTRSPRIGLGFAGMLAAALGALAGLAKLAAWAARRWSGRGMSYAVRQGIANLHRPNNHTALLLVSLGLGTFLILTLFFTRTSLLREIEDVGGSGRPDLVFIDIQDDQIGPFDRLMESRGTSVLRQAPVVAMKITAVKGLPVDQMLRDHGIRTEAWTLRREYRSTYRDRLAPDERLVSGAFVGRVDPGTALVPISIEEGLSRDMRVGIGDEIDWDVQGVPIRTRVSSVRAVDWRKFEPNFFVVFPDGVLDEAPRFYIAAVRAGAPAASAALQNAALAAFPNVTAIDLELVLETVDGILGKVSFVIEFMTLFTVAAGLAVLVASVMNGRRQRRRETILLRTLGASRRDLGMVRSVEYATLGVLAALTGSLLALVSAALLAREVFDTDLSAPLPMFAAAIAAVAAITLSTGWVADRGFLKHPPLEALRDEG